LSADSITPSGDTFYSAFYLKTQPEDPHPHACVDGYVYIGHVVEGEETEQTERLPCRRCAEAKEDARV
jgi:hypothetical protein